MRESSLLPYALFGLSGFAGLLYEVVWTRRLVLGFGATVYSFSTVLAGFMAGLALGAVWGARLADRSKDPWRLYARLELAVAAAAAAFPWTVDGILWLLERSDIPLAPARFPLCFLALLPATALMGATFPALAEHLSRQGRSGRVGLLYAANLAGACLGVLSGAFFLLSAVGLSGTQAAAVALNAAVGAAAWARPQPSGRRAGKTTADGKAGPAAGLVFAAAASGFCAMAFEVVWTRILVPSFNNSAYGYSSVLFVFLLGLGGGGWISGRIKAPSLAGIGAALAAAGLYGFLGLSTFELTQLVGLRLADMRRADVAPVLLLPLLEALVVLGPLAVLQGIALPAALRLAAEDGGAGLAAGRLYGWNTLAGIAGSLAAGFWLIPAYSSRDALMIVVAASALSGSLLLAAGPRRPWLKVALPAAALALSALGRAWLVERRVFERLLVERLSAVLGSAPRLLAYSDDVEASVGVLTHPDRSRILSINGVIVTGYTSATQLIAHIPLLVCPEPRRALVIGFGMGTTYRSALQHGGTVAAADLVGSVFDAFPWFFPDARRWAADPRGRRYVQDGRNRLLVDREGFDVVAIDPSPPLYAAGTVNLYSRDFYLLARRHLRPRGLVAMWLPEYPEIEFRMLMKTFVGAFPYVQFWRGTPGGGGLVMLGSNEPIELDKARISRRLRRPEIRRDLLLFNRDLEEEKAFWMLYLGGADRFRAYLGDAPEITDDRPRIEYPYFRSLRSDYLLRPAVLSWPAAELP